MFRCHKMPCRSARGQYHVATEKKDIQTRGDEKGGSKESLESTHVTRRGLPIKLEQAAWVGVHHRRRRLGARSTVDVGTHSAIGRIDRGDVSDTARYLRPVHVRPLEGSAV